MKDILIRASEGIMETLELPEEEHTQVDGWLNQYLSLEDLQSAINPERLIMTITQISNLYEVHKVETTLEDELPLLIGNLKSSWAKTELEKRMKA